VGQEGRKYRTRTLQEAAERGKVQLPIPEIHEKAMNTARSKGGSKVWNEFKDGTTRDKLDKKGGFEGAVWDWDLFERRKRKQEAAPRSPVSTSPRGWAEDCFHRPLTDFVPQLRARSIGFMFGQSTWPI
jgi:hypothetical protein